MRIGVVLSPVADWAVVIEAARAADALGFDAVGLWDHYHSAQPEWAYVAGWSAHSALAQATDHVGIVPAVLNSLHYELGVLAKETAVLSLVSSGRFEMAVGAGDWPGSYAAWGKLFPDRAERIARLRETVELLRRLWTAELVTFAGRFNQLTSAACTPVPVTPPRVIVGVGKSASLAESAVVYADELNIYGDEDVLKRVTDLVNASGRTVDVSVFFSWEWEKWPADPVAEISRWRDLGIERVFVSLGSNDMLQRMEQIAPQLSK
jgi:alkanesulfonate monooxygenase SsuD/methylene tetrahydromethanopterin reductase-like flavin-dependent oxidoreductase (luciferase family)